MFSEYTIARIIGYSYLIPNPKWITTRVATLSLTKTVRSIEKGEFEYFDYTGSMVHSTIPGTSMPVYCGFGTLVYTSGLTKSRGFAWPQVLCTGPVGIFSVVSRFDALERKCEKSLGVEVQIVRQPARRSDGFAIPRPDGLRLANRRNRL